MCKNPTIYFNLQIKNAFQAKYPGAPIPNKMTIRRMYIKQNRYFSLHNLCSKDSPGDSHSGRRKSARTPEKIDAVKMLRCKDVKMLRFLNSDCQKAYDDPTISTSRRNDITSKSLGANDELNICLKLVVLVSNTRLLAA